MRITLAALAVALGFLVGCSKSTSSDGPPPVKNEAAGALTEAQITAALKECLAPRWTLKSVGPIAPKGNNETEVHLAFKSADADGKVDAKGTAIFMRDQSGKHYLKETWLGYDNCEADLPKPVK